jgi:hypothetical protein
MISFVLSGSFDKTESFLKAMQKLNVTGVLDACGREGVTALASATPVNSGLTAHSWNYKVGQKGGVYFISWNNTDVENGFPVAIMLQYGYGTGTGGFVQGRDYINPAIRPIFDKIATNVWKVVTSA